MKNKFPKDFLWGASTSSYQIEGGNSNSDWWQWEERGKTKDKSGKACDYWNRWRADHELLSDLGVNSFRLSLEWARLEPVEGEFSEKAFIHYQEILQDLKSRNIKTIVTFWHWTSPIWFQEKYGFHKKESVEIFSRYTEKIMQKLGDLIDIVVVFNEPMVPLGMGFLGGTFPPGYKNPWKFMRAVNNLAKAYKKAYMLIHEKHSTPVGISYLYNWYEAEGFGSLFKMVNNFAQWYRIGLLGDKIKGFQDYFGIDYYRLGKIKFDKKNIKWDAKKQIYFGFTIEEDENNLMKWIAYPEGLYKVLKEANVKFKLPIYIMENGVPTGTNINDEERVKFIQEHMVSLEKAIADGVNVKGYNFWSLLDNYEWLYGFEPRFGLVEIDYQTLERKPRKSFYVYQEIIERNK